MRLGNFDYQKMAMVEDLRQQETMLIENELSRSIAGDDSARANIAASQKASARTNSMRSRRATSPLS